MTDDVVRSSSSSVVVSALPVHEAHEAVPLKLAAHVEPGLNSLWLAVDELCLDICGCQCTLWSSSNRKQANGSYVLSEPPLQEHVEGSYTGSAHYANKAMFTT
jgi:hypothetical protein